MHYFSRRFTILAYIPPLSAALEIESAHFFYIFTLLLLSPFSAMMGAAVSIFVAHYFLHNYGHWQSPMLTFLWGIFVLVWTTSIALSRVYLGAHTFQDIVAGSLLGSVYGVAMVYFTENVNIATSDSPIYPFLVTFAIILCFLGYHPIDRSSATNFHLSEGTADYSMSLLGVAAGAFFHLRSCFLVYLFRCHDRTTEPGVAWR